MAWCLLGLSAQPRMTLVLVRKRLSKMIGMYNMCIQPYSFPWYWSFQYLSKWSILYWIYIYIYRSWNSPAITDLFEHRFLTSKHVLVLYEPVEVGTKSFKIGICSTATKKRLKQKLSVSQLPLNVLCGEILLVWNLYLKKNIIDDGSWLPTPGT